MRALPSVGACFIAPPAPPAAGPGGQHLTAVTSKIGVVRPAASGTPVFSLDNLGTGVFGPGDSVFSYGLNSDRFITGDWNGSGYDKVGVVRANPDGTAQFVLDTNGDGVFGPGDQVFTFGLATDTILVGDWNGDGRSKIGVVRFDSRGAATVTLDTNGDGVFDAGDQVFSFGKAGDRFLVGDWNGDGRGKLGVVRNDGRGGALVILDSYGGGPADLRDALFPFGYFGDTFVVGDWNGDGRSKIGVVRPTAAGTAVFALDTNGDGAYDAGDQVFTFGLNGDTFLVGKWKAPAAAPASDTIQGLTVDGLKPIIQQAINLWIAAGLDAAHVQILQQAPIRITQLNGTALAVTVGRQISLDGAADGYSWFVDPTPAANEEYTTTTAKGLQAPQGTPAGNGIDLLTVITHEMGHVLGLGHSTQTDDVMAASIGPGVRRLPTHQDVLGIPALVSGVGSAGQYEHAAPLPPCGCPLCRGLSAL